MGSRREVACIYTGFLAAGYRERKMMYGKVAQHVCPSCRQIDCLRKVSTVVNAGGYYSGTDGGQTWLSQTLSPPRFPSRFSSRQGFGWCLLFFAAITALSVTFGGGHDILWNLGVASFSGNSYATYGRPAILTGIAELIAVLVFGVASLVFGFWWSFIDRHKRKQKLRRFRPIWEQEMFLWNDMYYCYRCDVVTLPESARYAPRTDMHGFLYQIASSIIV